MFTLVNKNGGDDGGTGTVVVVVERVDIKTLSEDRGKREPTEIKEEVRRLSS